MSNNEKWKGMSPKEFFDRLPRETLRIKLGRSVRKVMKKFSKNRRTITGCKGRVGGGHISHTTSPTPVTTFKESYRVNNPYSLGAKDIEIMGEVHRALDAYEDSLPGYYDE